MDEFSTQSDLLMRYLDEDLQGAEREAFEKMLAENEALRVEMESLSGLRTVIKRYGLKQQVDGVRAKMLAGEEKPAGILRIMRRNALRIAAMAILLLGIAALYEYLTVSPSSLYNSHFVAYAPPVTRGTVDSSVITRDYLENKDSALVSIYKSNDAQSEADILLAGNAYLRLQNYPAAADCFSLILQKNKLNGTHRFEDDAEYYLALSYLANKEIDKALPLFQRINADKSHAYHDKVDDWFLRKLKWLK